MGQLFTNILPADLIAIGDSIKAYDLSHENPDFALQNKKFMGTAALLDLFKRGEATTANMFDYFYGYYQKTRPDLVKLLGDCLAMDSEGVRNTGIIAMCVESNPPVGLLTNAIEKVKMKIVELNLIATSDIYGLSGIAKFRHGTYHVELRRRVMLPSK